MPNEVLLTTSEVARRLDKSLSTIRRLADSGEIPAAQKLPGPNGAYLFRPIDVERYEHRLALARAVS